MKMSISNESVAVLREFADKIPAVVENIIEDTKRLIEVYNNVEDEVGPHREDFLQLFHSINRSQKASGDAIKELSYILRCTADKMESYINYGTAGSSILQGNNTDYVRRYHTGTEGRLKTEGSNVLVKELYNEYSDEIRIIDFDHTGVAYYSPSSKGIKLNAMADMHNPTGNFSTYFHEAGHMVDDYAGNGHTWLSSDPEYRKCLYQDMESYVQKTIVCKHCERPEAYDIISEEISGVWNPGVSDIFGSLTECRCQGTWGHDPSYWQEDTTRVEKEAFANMFEASIGSGEKLENMKKYFPRAYARFEYIIRSR